MPSVAAAHRIPASGVVTPLDRISMTDQAFGADFSVELISRISAAIGLREVQSRSGGPLLELVNIVDGTGAGALRLWAITDDNQLDRLIHWRLLSPPVDTNLLFLFGRPGTAVPHFHAQVVQFGPDACVYNADIIPRLDAVEHPDHFTEVYGPITKAFWTATTDRQNVCSMAPANPAIAVYLSPWSIAAGRPTNREELRRVTPSILAYLDHCLALARSMTYTGATAEELASRDRRHLELLHSETLDPRSWKGVHRVLGAEVAQHIREVLHAPVR